MRKPRGQWLVLIALLAGPVCLAQESRPAAGPASQTGPYTGLEAQPVVSSSRPGKEPGPESTLLRRDDTDPLAGWGRTVLALAVVLGVLLVLRAVLKRLGRRGPMAPGGAMEVMARSSVSPRQQLLLVRLGGQLLLLGSSPAGLCALHVVSDPEEVAELTEAAMGGHSRPRFRGESDKPRGGQT